MLPTIFAMIFLTLFSFLYSKLGKLIVSQNSIIPILFLIIFVLINLLVLSYIFSGLINLCLIISNNNQKAGLSDIFKAANKYWLKNFVIIIIIYLCYNIIRIIATYGVSYFGKSLSLSVESAKFIFFFVYFAGLIGLLIFFTFSNFFLILENLGIIKSIKKSAIFVTRNYLSVLAISVIFYVIFRLIGFFDLIYASSAFSISEIISSIIIYPYLALVLSRFLIVNYKK